MKLKRLAALSLAGIMTMGLMAGCGNDNAASSSGQSSSQPQSQADVHKESSKPEEESKAPTGEKKKSLYLPGRIPWKSSRR